MTYHQNVHIFSLWFVSHTYYTITHKTDVLMSALVGCLNFLHFPPPTIRFFTNTSPRLFNQRRIPMLFNTRPLSVTAFYRHTPVEINQFYAYNYTRILMLVFFYIYIKASVLVYITHFVVIRVFFGLSFVLFWIYTKANAPRRYTDDINLFCIKNAFFSTLLSIVVLLRTAIVC